MNLFQIFLLFTFVLCSHPKKIWLLYLYMTSLWTYNVSHEVNDCLMSEVPFCLTSWHLERYLPFLKMPRQCGTLFSYHLLLEWVVQNGWFHLLAKTPPPYGVGEKGGILVFSGSLCFVPFVSVSQGRKDCWLDQRKLVWSEVKMKMLEKLLKARREGYETVDCFECLLISYNSL